MTRRVGRAAAFWIAGLGLERHPEGGWYRQTYRAPESIAATSLPQRFGAPRVFATAIYFLLEQGEVSHLHRLRADELWFFHAGGTLLVHAIDSAGTLATQRLGAAPDAAFQAMVSHGHWFGGELAVGSPFALVSCTVAPGFEFADFEMADRAALAALFPQHRDVIARLT